jgi:hypothetical protein
VVKPGIQSLQSSVNNQFLKKQQHYSIFYCFGQFAAEVNILG